MLNDAAPDQLIAGIIMNIVAQEERHVARAAALAGRDLEADETIDFIYSQTIKNVVKRFPGTVQSLVREMLEREGMRDMIKADMQRHKQAAWLTT